MESAGGRPEAAAAAVLKVKGRDAGRRPNGAHSSSSCLQHRHSRRLVSIKHEAPILAFFSYSLIPCFFLSFFLFSSETDRMFLILLYTLQFSVPCLCRSLHFASVDMDRSATLKLCVLGFCCTSRAVFFFQLPLFDPFSVGEY